MMRSSVVLPDPLAPTSATFAVPDPKRDVVEQHTPIRQRVRDGVQVDMAHEDQSCRFRGVPSNHFHRSLQAVSPGTALSSEQLGDAVLLEDGLDVGEVVGGGRFRHLALGWAPGFCSSARGLPAFETLADDEQDAGER